MLVLSDQIGRSIVLPHLPARIVSLVPSQTELLHHLGLDSEVVGITKFCIHPESWFRTKTRIGGTKDIDPDRIDALRPDLILAAKEENQRGQIEDLANRYPVWTSDVTNLSSALDMIRSIGSLTGRQIEADSLAGNISDRFIALSNVAGNSSAGLDAVQPTSFPIGTLQPARVPIRTAYLIWKGPYMSVGGDTFIHDMLTRAGFDNIFKDQTRYPVATPESLREIAPDLLLLSSEPYPFKQKHIDELQPILPDTRILLVDGEMFSWYGSRLLEAPRYFQDLRDTLAQKFDL